MRRVTERLGAERTPFASIIRSAICSSLCAELPRVGNNETVALVFTWTFAKAFGYRDALSAAAQIAAGLPGGQPGRGIDGVDLDEAAPLPERPRSDIGLIVGGWIGRLTWINPRAPICEITHEVVQKHRADALTALGVLKRRPKDLHSAGSAAIHHREPDDALGPDSHPARMGPEIALHLLGHVLGEVVRQAPDDRDAALDVSIRGVADCCHHGAQ